MADTCPRCGLPLELCVCKVLDRETESKIKVYAKKAKFDKVVTIVEGINPDEIDRTSKELKHALACGGTVRGTTIELQGEHKLAVKKALSQLGYKESNIDVA
ncbi:MAG: stress response translation initiation inhibitor YciH [Candidatus Marsarchaeota archaeon]|nr:stress response translation initiation inhibitor YciH [Candidatus Marsarchaeota archaeon]